MGYSLSNQSSSSATSSGYSSVGFMFAPQTGTGNSSGGSSIMTIARGVIALVLVLPMLKG